MPELPEVEVLVRRLRPLLHNKRIKEVVVRREKVIRPASARRFRETLRGAKFVAVNRRGKYLLFTMRMPGMREPRLLIGHLGMTGRFYLQRRGEPVAKHAAVIFDLGRMQFVFEDTRYFGRLTLNADAASALGPEPLSDEFTPESFGDALRHSRQSIKVKLLDQSLVAGIGNIYASEALYLARVPPRTAAHRLRREQVRRLHQAIRQVMAEAIELGSTIPLNWSGNGDRDGLFYFGRAVDAPDYYEERLRVYDRAGEPCFRCRTPIRRIVQAARSTYYCPHCQHGEPRRT